MLDSRRRRSVLLLCSLVLLGVLLAALAAGADDPGEALREAARAGDLARVDALLAAGAPVDAPARYGQTPLYFAAEKGHLAVAKRLVERGANVNAKDGFFGASALEMALQGGHNELVRHLLAHGAEDATSALWAALENDDLEMARAALATGFVEPLDLTAARRQAQGAAGPMSELLAAATAKPRQRPPYKAAPERLPAYAGKFRQGQEAGKEAMVAVRGNGLGLTLPGE
ncbi:MAG TPA: ankyrin repeat domain-containing protein, partial [Thermoanaerobaculia bacterium]|nr:ankyrin repeat domain-containing protein [Thermoanaerobaculia bacterium]